MAESNHQSLSISKLEAVGDYIVGKTLGEGSFGKVKLGVHRKTNMKVALKLVDRERLVKAKDQTNLEREIKILKLISHPRIVKLIDVFELSSVGLTVLVMEYVPGGDLFDLITKENRLSEPKAAKLFRQMVDAVDYLHKNLIIHRDLKPENIMIDENCNVKINDFGLSNFMKIKEGELMATFCGSPHYASPEIMRERRYIGPEVDVWSLGVLLYTMCTGLFPWEGDNLAEVMKNAVRARYVVPEFLSEDCKSVIARMLEPDPQKRATIPEIKSHPWLNDGLRIPQQVDKRKKVTQIDERIFKRLRDFGLNEDEARRQILGNQFTSQAFVLYTLIEEYLEKQKSEGRSISSSSTANTSPTLSASGTVLTAQPLITASGSHIITSNTPGVLPPVSPSQHRIRTGSAPYRPRVGSTPPAVDTQSVKTAPASPMVTTKHEATTEREKPGLKRRDSSDGKKFASLFRLIKRRDSHENDIVTVASSASASSSTIESGLGGERRRSNSINILRMPEESSAPSTPASPRKGAIPTLTSFLRRASGHLDTPSHSNGDSSSETSSSRSSSPLPTRLENKSIKKLINEST